MEPSEADELKAKELAKAVEEYTGPDLGYGLYRAIEAALSTARAEGEREGVEAAIAAIPRTLYIAGSGKAGIEVRAAVEAAIRRAMEVDDATAL